MQKRARALGMFSIVHAHYFGSDSKCSAWQARCWVCTATTAQTRHGQLRATPQAVQTAAQQPSRLHARQHQGRKGMGPASRLDTLPLILLIGVIENEGESCLGLVKGLKTDLHGVHARSIVAQLILSLLLHHPMHRSLHQTHERLLAYLFLCLKDDLLYLHLIEDVITFDSLAQRHDLIGHETARVSIEQCLFAKICIPKFVLMTL